MSSSPRAVPQFALIFAVLLLPRAAAAATGTYTPPMLRGDLSIGYDGGIAAIQLEDRSNDDSAWVEVAEYQKHHHCMQISGAFTPYHGISVGLAIPILFHGQLNWRSGNSFHYAPVTERATMAGADGLDDEILDASPARLRRFGFGDLGLNFRIVPFAQHGLPNRQAPISMAFDVNLRFPTGQNPLKTREDGTGYPGIGGIGITVGTTAARSFGAIEPYLSIHYTHNGPYQLEDDEDAEEGEEVDEEQRAGDSFSLRAGSHIVAYHDGTKGRSVHLDLSLKAAYFGPEHTRSGIHLPTTLPETIGQAAVVSEHLEVGGAFELAISPRPQLEIHMDFEAAWISPHSVERVSKNAYSVRTRNGSLGLHWGAGVRIHFL